MQATRGISDLITIPGMVNLDFNDVRTVISKGGDAIMALENTAAKSGLRRPRARRSTARFWKTCPIVGAKGVLINIAGDSNLTLYEINEVMSLINEETGSDAEIIFGTVIDDSLAENIRVTVIATGFNLNKGSEAEPAAREQEDRCRTWSRIR